MSYNVSSARYLSGRLFVVKSAQLAERFDEQRGECSLSDLVGPGGRLTRPAPTGECSGAMMGDPTWFYAMTRGEAEIMLTWEGGDSFTGWHVRDGEVTERRVEHSLAIMEPA